MTKTGTALRRALGLVCASALVAGLAACGGDDAEQADSESTAITEPPPMMPTSTRRQTAPIPVGEAHYRDALAELENQLAVEWVDHEGNEVYVGVVASAYQNDRNPVVAAALRAHKTKGEPVTAYIVDAQAAEKGWRPGGDGLIDTLKMPLELNLGGGRDDDAPVDQ